MKKKKIAKKVNKKDELQQPAIDYLDLSADEDRSLRLVSRLLFKMDGNENLDSFDTQELACKIDRYLLTKHALEHVFFERKISSYSLRDDLLKAEIKRISTLLACSKKI